MDFYVTVVMKPSFRNLFMKKFTREQVVPIISASVSWLILAITGSGDVAITSSSRNGKSTSAKQYCPSAEHGVCLSRVAEGTGAVYWRAAHGAFRG